MNLIAVDLDGTLEDSRADMVAAARRVRQKLGLPARPDEALRPWVNQGMEQLYRNCFDDYLAGGAGRYAEVEKAYEADYTAHVAVETRLYPGVPEALRRLHEFARPVVVTNKPDAISLHLLKTLDIADLVAGVVG